VRNNFPVQKLAATSNQQPLLAQHPVPVTDLQLLLVTNLQLLHVLPLGEPHSSAQPEAAAAAETVPSPQPIAVLLKQGRYCCGQHSHPPPNPHAAVLQAAAAAPSPAKPSAKHTTADAAAADLSAHAATIDQHGRCCISQCSALQQGQGASASCSARVPLYIHCSSC
jgi:hypothetical protein